MSTDDFVKRKQRRWSRIAYRLDQEDRIERRRAKAERKEARRRERKAHLVVCPYCQERASLVGGAVIYPFRPDMHEKRFYLCAPCSAWVGCHPGTERPLGVPANAETRQARVNAHDVFDVIWKTGRMARREAYAWLAEQLGIPVEECHISWFGREECQQAVRICERYWAHREIASMTRTPFCRPIPFGPSRSAREPARNYLRGA